jgi:sulfhydrogenase subunit beta (sulfur reductase)
MGYVLDRDGIDGLLTAIARRGFRLVGPVIADGAICYGDIESSADLPVGWTDEQDGGTYQLRRRDDDALFGYNVGPQSPKKYLFPATATLWRSARSDEGADGSPDGRPFAFIGLRACELRAIAIQDRVFLGGSGGRPPGGHSLGGSGGRPPGQHSLGGEHPDPLYARHREGAFTVAVNCGQAARTCFCVSMSAGPKADEGFDLALTELLDDGGHRFLIETGTARGEQVMAEVPDARPAAAADREAADGVVERTAAQMGRAMPDVDLRDLLYDNMEHPRWDDVADRCLTCGNCTMVCPTCFCFSVEDVTDLTGEQAERHRSWDSCFTLDHSYIHGGPVRTSSKSRYRQWMTHKLATWIDQFGTSGCVGCGRCIAWCPVGIDITEEVAAIAGDS